MLVHQKGIKNGQKWVKNDFLQPFGVSLEVFLARSEAPLSRFDFRRVVSFTYPQRAFQTMHALQKGPNGVVPKREKPTPFSSVLVRSLD